MQIARNAIPQELLSGTGGANERCLGCEDCRGICLAVLEMLSASGIKARPN